MYIAGRKAEAAAKVLESAKDASIQAGNHTDGQVFSFHKFDASLIKDCVRFSEEMKQVFEGVGGLHFLIMCQGGMGNGNRRETEEGHEWSVESCIVIGPITLITGTLVIGSWHYKTFLDILRL